MARSGAQTPDRASTFRQETTMSDNYNRLFPQHLSRPFQVLFWETDDLAIVFLCMTIALVFGGVTWFLLILGPAAFGMLKRNRPRGFLRHLLYECGLLRYKGYPSSFVKNFRE
jgi:type IV conjugative transfer system protein TraL